LKKIHGGTLGFEEIYFHQRRKGGNECNPRKTPYWGPQGAQKTWPVTYGRLKGFRNWVGISNRVRNMVEGGGANLSERVCKKTFPRGTHWSPGGEERISRLRIIKKSQGTNGKTNGANLHLRQVRWRLAAVPSMGDLARSKATKVSRER